MFRRCVQLLLAVLFAILVVCNVRLYNETQTADAIAQLRFLRQALDDGAADEMQALFPEGFVFMHALYASAWIEVGRMEPVGSALRLEARAEGKWALDQLESPEGRKPFPANLEPAHGVFHAGWVNWIRGGLLSLYPDGERPAEERRVFDEQSVLLAEAFARSDTPYLQSYAGRAWPVDSVVAIASLRLHDRLGPARFEATIKRWRAQVEGRLDPPTGLIPHGVDPKSGKPIEGARGSSQALLLRFLLEIDPELGGIHYRRFRSHFVPSSWLLPGTREYPIGVEGPSDVDSGPLIGGVSLSASVAAIAPARLVHDEHLAAPLFQFGEAISMPVAWHGKRRYLFGQLPIADAFLVYSRTATSWNDPPNEVPAERIVPWGWRPCWHVLTLGPLAFLFWLTVRSREQAKVNATS